MELRSPDFENNELIPSRYTCDGENINPELEILDVPESSQSLVLIMDDPDAPNGTWVHWTVWNMDPSVRTIAAGTAPAGAIEGRTSFERTGYGGPCPPSGTHRYFFRIYALDTKLDLPANTKAEELADAMADHIISQAELVGLYAKDGV